MFRVKILMFLLLVQACAVMAQEPEYRSKNYPDGGIMYDGYFIGDKPVSITRYYESGHVKSVQVFDTNGNSTIIMYNMGGTLFADGGYNSDKRRDGVWKFYTYKRKLSNLVTYRDGVKEGQVIVYTESGLVLDSMNFVADKLDGERVKYFTNGQKQAVINYKAGVVDGAYVSFFDDGGKVMEGTFSNGVRDGIWMFYDKDGSYKEYKFKKGRCKKFEDFLKKESAEAEIDRHIAEPSFETIQ